MELTLCSAFIKTTQTQVTLTFAEIYFYSCFYFHKYNVRQVAHVSLSDEVTSLVVSCGYSTTHIIPVLNGRAQIKHCRRMNVGGSHIDYFMQRMLQLKYPGHYASVSLGRAEVRTTSLSIAKRNRQKQLELSS